MVISRDIVEREREGELTHSFTLSGYNGTRLFRCTCLAQTEVRAILFQ